MDLRTLLSPRRTLAPVALSLTGLVLGGCKSCAQEIASLRDAAPPPAASTTAAPAAPAPKGVETAASPPGKGDVTDWATDLAIAQAPGGETFLAYPSNDPNGDGDRKDAAIYFVSSDRKKNAWNAPVKIDETHGAAEGRGHHVAIARDASNGMLAIAYVKMVEENVRHIWLATSTDGGATWKTAQATKASGEDSGPSMVVTGGQVHMSFTSDHAFYVHGPAATPSSWGAAVQLPDLGDRSWHGGGVPALAVDASGDAGIVYGMNDDKGGLDFVFYRPKTAKPPVVIGTTGETQNDSYALGLAYDGAKPRAVFSSAIGKLDDGLWAVASNDDGTTWAKAVRIPNDGGQIEGPPIALALGAKGKAAATANVEGGNGDGTKCGAPKVSRSDDFAKWTTCSPMTDTNHGGDTPVVAFDGDTLVTAWVSHSTEPGPPGIFVSRGP